MTEKFVEKRANSIENNGKVDVNSWNAIKKFVSEIAGVMEENYDLR